MKIAVHRESLVTAAKLAASVASTEPYDVLRHALLSCEGGTLTLSARDPTVFVAQRVAGQVSEPGSVAVSAVRFKQAVEAMTGATVTLSTSPTKRLLVACKGRKLDVAGLPEDEYADPPTMPPPGRVLASGQLARLIGRVIHAAGHPIQRPTVAGVRVECDGARLTVCALDGKRAMVVEEPTTLAPFDVTLPTRLWKVAGVAKVAPVAAALEDAGATFELAESENSIWLRRDDERIVIAARRLEGAYVPFRILADYVEKTSHTATVDRVEWLEAARVATLLASEDGCDPVRIVWSENAMTMTAEGSVDFGGEMALETATLRNEGAEPAVQIVNANYLRDALAALPGERVTVRCGGPLVPLLIDGLDEHGTSRATLMPMDR